MVLRQVTILSSINLPCRTSKNTQFQSIQACSVCVSCRARKARIFWGHQVHLGPLLLLLLPLLLHGVIMKIIGSAWPEGTYYYLAFSRVISKAARGRVAISISVSRRERDPLPLG